MALPVKEAFVYVSTTNSARQRAVKCSIICCRVYCWKACTLNTDTALYKRIASILAENRERRVRSTALWWLRSTVVLHVQCSFALLRSSVICLRGSRRFFANVAVLANSATIVVAEAAIAINLVVKLIKFSWHDNFISLLFALDLKPLKIL